MTSESIRQMLDNEFDKKKAHVNKKYSFWHLFCTPTLSRYTMVLAFAWFCVATISYTINFGVQDLPGNMHTNQALICSPLIVNNRLI